MRGVVLEPRDQAALADPGGIIPAVKTLTLHQATLHPIEPLTLDLAALEAWANEAAGADVVAPLLDGRIPASAEDPPVKTGAPRG